MIVKYVEVLSNGIACVLRELESTEANGTATYCGMVENIYIISNLLVIELLSL